MTNEIMRRLHRTFKLEKPREVFSQRAIHMIQGFSICPRFHHICEMTCIFYGRKLHTCSTTISRFEQCLTLFVKVHFHLSKQTWLRSWYHSNVVYIVGNISVKCLHIGKRWYLFCRSYLFSLLSERDRTCL